MSHAPVLLNEVIKFLNIRPDGTYLDCTGGRGGHAHAVLQNLNQHGKLYVCDYHEASVAYLRKKFQEFESVTVLHSRFSSVFDNLDFPFDGILADFGISSPQLEDDSLGFGFLQEDVFLDMRIDKRLKTTATDILKTKSKEELANIFYYFGGEKQSRKIASAIVMDREKKQFYETTTALRGLCERVLGRYYRKRKIHPATKIFQALRIAVNEELEEIEKLLDQAPQRLKKNGRFVTISFHEGEDRLVKNKFRELAQTKDFFLPVRKAVKPGDKEIQNNPRARSAKLRVLEKN